AESPSPQSGIDALGHDDRGTTRGRSYRPVPPRGHAGRLICLSPTRRSATLPRATAGPLASPRPSKGGTVGSLRMILVCVGLLFVVFGTVAAAFVGPDDTIMIGEKQVPERVKG